MFKIVVLEELNLLSFVFAIIYRRRGDRLVCFSIRDTWLTRLARRILARWLGLEYLGYKDFPGTYQKVIAEAITRATDRFFSRRVVGSRFLTFLLAFKRHELTEKALKKEMLRSYIMPRVKSFIFLRQLACEEVRPVVFIPVDNEEPADITKLLSLSRLGIRIPAMLRIANRLKGVVLSLAFVWYAHRLVASILYVSGLVWSRPETKQFGIAYDMHDDPPGRSPDYEGRKQWNDSNRVSFLYDDKIDLLRPENILHVHRWSMNDGSHRFYEERGYPYAEFGRTKVPFGYFLKRVLGDFYLGFIRSGIVDAVSGTLDAQWIGSAYRVAHYVIRFEVLFKAYSVGVFVARDESVYSHIIRTMVLEENGGKTVGFAHGEYIHPSFPTAYVCMSTFCFWGDYPKRFYHGTSIGRSEIIGGGIFGLDQVAAHEERARASKKYEHRIKGRRVLVAYDSSFAPDFWVTREMTLDFYRTVLELANRYHDLFLILKPKVDHISDQEFDSLIQSVLPEGTDRVAVEKELDTYEMFPISDYMVVTYVSTIGLEGIMADKKVLFFDVSESNQDLVYGSYDENLVSFSKEEFWKSAHWLLEEGCYVPQPVLEKIVRLHGLCFDGKVTRRFKDAVLSAYSSSRETL